MSRGTGQSEHLANTRTGVAAGWPNEPPEYAPRPRPGVLVTSTVFPVRLQPRSTYIRALHSPALIDDEDSRFARRLGIPSNQVHCTGTEVSCSKQQNLTDTFRLRLDVRF